MNRKIKVLIVFSLFALTAELFPQTGEMAGEISSLYNRGMELFAKEKYVAAIKCFDSFLADRELPDGQRREDAAYYSAVSSMKLFNPDAEFRMISFINNYPGSYRIYDAWVALGDYFYQNKNYRKASTCYDKVNRAELVKDNLPSFCFKNGYSHLMRGDKKIAMLMFSEIKDVDTDYTSPALYYFSHLAYEDKMYETALEGFLRLKEDETFGPVVPFYIVQILYLKKDYDGILTLAPGLLKSAGQQRAVELYRFIGDAYYNKGNYREAISYLEKYAAGAKASAREDRYQLGYCYYKTGEADKAIAVFLELTAASDVLSQNIWCLLGDSYLKKGDKKRARFAFGQASLMDFDRKLKEESLFNYAKLTFEVSDSPFGESIIAFQEYIDLFPGSDRIEEVYNYLVATYMQIKNYKAALSSLDKIANKPPRLEEAYQRVSFFRGLELLKNMELQAAADMFDKSLKYEKYNRELRARAIYWRGEAFYRLGRYDQAMEDYKQFMGIPGAMLLKEYKTARYNLGYTYFNNKEYSQALTNFKAFEADSKDVLPPVLADCRNRIADCYFVNTNYSQAIDYYNMVIGYGKVDADYAMFQKAFALGLTNNHRGKADMLTTLISTFPTSKYIPAAWFERGRANVTNKETKRGEADFNQLITSYQASPYVPRAMVQLGLLYFDNNENDKAIGQFKKVITGYKSSPEARYALTGLKNAYADMNDVASYFAYVKTLGGYGDVSTSEKDSLMYSSGERLYMAGNCARATETFVSYLDEFQNGIFRVNALFYLADCAYSLKKFDEAEKYFSEIIQQPGNNFIQQSLLALGEINFRKEDFSKALAYYERLEKAAEAQDYTVEALRGGLRSAYQAGDPVKTIAIASRIAAVQGIPEELGREALFMSGKAFYSQNQDEEALAAFRKLAVEVVSVQGAESKYRVAELLNRKKQVAEAEKVINEFIDQNTPHQYWMARMFLLLADISTAKGDKIQAIATLRGLKDIYPVDNDGIIDEVKAKLDALVPAEDKGAGSEGR
jgi:TolA-binding protein